MTVRYVLGFPFIDGNRSVFKRSVLLVEKQYGPEINIGKMNGIGGKIDDGESPEDAMVREFLEETACVKPHWTRIGRMSGEGWEIDIFKSLFEGGETSVNDVGEQHRWEYVGDVLNPDARSFYAQNVPTMVMHAVAGDGELNIKVSQ